MPTPPPAVRDNGGVGMPLPAARLRRTQRVTKLSIGPEICQHTSGLDYSSRLHPTFSAFPRSPERWPPFGTPLAFPTLQS